MQSTHDGDEVPSIPPAEGLPGRRRPRPSGPRLRLLLAEDDAEVRRLLAETLRKDGHTVIEVSTGAALFDYLRLATSEDGRCKQLDVLVSDIRMPGMSGLEVLSRLRQTDATLPTILITAFGDHTTHTQAKDLNAVAVFNKPFDIDDLRTVIVNLARRSDFSAEAP